jgi:ribokinase
MSNQAVAAALAGARAAMVARIGNDPEGETARNGLAGHGVDVAHVHRVAGVATGITVAAGDNAIVVISGANHRWKGEGDPLSGEGAGAAVVVAQ